MKGLSLRPRIVCGACLMLCSLSVGQWREKDILLPDSLGGIAYPQAMVWDSADNKVFVGGDSGVLVIDGATDTRVARVWTNSTVVALCYNPQNNRVYCANYESADVTVIDR